MTAAREEDRPTAGSHCQISTPGSVLRQAAREREEFRGHRRWGDSGTERGGTSGIDGGAVTGGTRYYNREFFAQEVGGNFGDVTLICFTLECLWIKARRSPRDVYTPKSH